MKFSELMERVKGRGVKVLEMRAGAGAPAPTPWPDGTGGSDPEILGVCDDSRKVKAGDLFVARAGVKADGAKFVADALARGAAAVVTGESDQWPVASGQNEVAVAVVGEVNQACALLSHEVAGNPTSAMKVIGVTGTKGKTTVAYLLRSVLKAAGHKVGMIGTVEIDDGHEAIPADMTTPGSVELVGLFSRMKAHGVTHCVMEVSSHALHQHRVAGIDFSVAVFTNLTGDHLDYHKTMEEYAAAKAMLFEGLGETALAVVNADDGWAQRMVVHCRARVVNYRVIDEVAAIAENSGAEWRGAISSMARHGMMLHIMGPKTGGTFYTGMIGRHNAANIVATFAAAYELGLHGAPVYRTLKEARGAPGRLQRVGNPAEGILPFEVVVDYAHTHDALENVLKALRATLDPGGRLLCVFGCGGDRDRTKRPKMGAVAERLADRVIVTSDNPRTEDPAAIIDEICTGFSAGWRQGGKITVEPDRRAAIRTAIAGARDGDVVLIAGKGHENYQIIGTTKHHFDDVEEAQAALQNAFV